MKYIKYMVQLNKILICSLIACIFIKDKDIVLIGERKNEAKDNGYWLFKYIRENYPKEKLYYIIDKQSDDIEKIKPLGNIIYMDTFKHYLYYIASKKLICAHQGSCTPQSPWFWKLRDIGILKKKRVYIKHGIIKEKINTHMYSNTNFEKIICGAKPEYDFVKKELGYPNNSVKYLGLCRFDQLHNFKVKKQILVMPTWRQWIPNSTWGGKEEDFLKSDYYNKYNELLNSKFLNEYLTDNDMKLIFYPHYETQPFLKFFKINNSRIILATNKNYDVQQLLKESSILITDYSSIAFDFAYMKKPIIYYQFDKDLYYEKHYSKGYFEYERDGFGPVIQNINQLKQAFEEIDNNKNIYLERVDNFFTIHDDKNCERHYREIFKD